MTGNGNALDVIKMKALGIGFIFNIISDKKFK